MVAGPFQWLAPQSGTLFRILSGSQPSVQTVSDAYLRRTCLLDTSALSALEVLWRLLRYINLLTYLLTYGRVRRAAKLPRALDRNRPASRKFGCNTMTRYGVSVQLTDWVDAVTRSVLSNFVELCVFDVARTDTQTVTEAIQSFNGTVQITSVFSRRIIRLINRLISIVCPGQPACNGRGRCVNSTCVCDTGTAYRVYAVDTYISVYWTTDRAQLQQEKRYKQ